MTLILHCNWWEYWSRDTDVSIIISSLSFKGVFQAPLGYRSFQIGCVFVECDLFYYYESFTKSYIYLFWYNFDTDLYQVLETGTSDRTLISLYQLPRFSGFSLYPLSFYLYSPLQHFL